MAESPPPVGGTGRRNLDHTRKSAHHQATETTVDEIGQDIYRLSTWVPDVTEQGFTFNQFLLTGDEPFLFHCGHRQLFPLVSEAVNRIVPLDKLRWISFGHVEADVVSDSDRAEMRTRDVHGRLSSSTDRVPGWLWILTSGAVMPRRLARNIGVSRSRRRS